jgi:Tfp pilus assembly protein PilW
MKQDRFLTGILIGILVLIIAALVVFVTRRDQQAYVSDDTPQGVVHNYVLALLNKDYQKAYGYLADLDNKPSLDQFRQAFVTGRLGGSNAGVQIGKATVTGDSASVEVIMAYSSSDPFNQGYNDSNEATLVMQNGLWKISAMPDYNLWDYGWYQKP